MDRIDFQQLKSGEVNLGVCFSLICVQDRTLDLVVDLNHGRPIRQGSRHWSGQSYNHRQLHCEIIYYCTEGTMN
jgi:hypothetical protein